jgi:hypothetical protein
MKTSEYLDKVRANIGAPSDYALQKPLGLSRSRLSNFRQNLDFFSDGLAIKVADLAGLDAGFVLLDMHLSRAKSPEEKAAWLSICADVN